MNAGDIANLLCNYERLYSDPEEAMRVYTKQCSVGINTKDLGFMGATLANGGVNPKTGKRLLDAEHVPETAFVPPRRPTILPTSSSSAFSTVAETRGIPAVARR